MLAQQLSFLMELDKLKAVYRQTQVASDNNRFENSAEHSWHIAMLAQILQEYARQPIDVNRVVQMLLIHDVVEIDAGDTFAFEQDNVHDQQEAVELQAAERIFGLLPVAQADQFKALWIEFEQAETQDARFAKGMDRILPFIQNMADGGGSWLRHGISRPQVLKRNSYLKESAPALWTYVCEQVELAVGKGWLKPA